MKVAKHGINKYALRAALTALHFINVMACYASWGGVISRTETPCEMDDIWIREALIMDIGYGDDFYQGIDFAGVLGKQVVSVVS